MGKVFVVIISTLYTVQAIQDRCLSYQNKTISFSLGTFVNQSCHQITKWSITKNLPNIPDSTKADVKSSIFEANGRRTLNIQGVIVAPTQVSEGYEYFPDAGNYKDYSTQVPEGYEYFPGVGYYKFYWKGAKTYMEAKNNCEKDGAHLAIINSNEEAKVLMDIYKKFPEAGLIAYLGFHDMNREGEFETIFGEPFITAGYANWNPGDPDNWNNEDCGAMTKYGLLVDSPCDKNGPWPYFCEFNLH